MARRPRSAARETDFEGTTALALDTRAEPEEFRPLTGPHDAEDLDPEMTDAVGRVDFGAIQVPVPRGGKVTVEPTAKGRMQAVHVALPEGRLSISALAAPKSARLWPELAREIDASLRDGGARVRSFSGDWGRELHAVSGEASSVFVGVDGPRWMIYGVATGSTPQKEVLDAELRRMLRGTVVVRGKSPYPVRTILPLVVPEHLKDAVEKTAEPDTAKRTAGTRKPGQKKAGSTSSGPKKAGQKRTGPTAEPEPAPKTAAKSGPKPGTKQPPRTVTRRQAAAVNGSAEHLGPDAPSTGYRDELTPGSILAVGPSTDAPLRDHAPSARRAAAGAWRYRSAAARSAEPPVPPSEVPTRPEPVTPPPGSMPPVPAQDQAPARRPAQRRPPVDDGWVDTWDDAPEPVRRVPQAEPGTGGRRRLREPGPATPEPAADTGRRRLREPHDEPSRTGSRPVEPGSGGRRRLREDHRPASPPAAEAPEPPTTAVRTVRPAATPPPEPETTGRRRLREPGPDPIPVPAAEPGGRRRLREPDAGGPAPRPPQRPADPDPGPARESSTTGRRRLREPGPSAGVPADDGWYDVPTTRTEASRPAADRPSGDPVVPDRPARQARRSKRGNPFDSVLDEAFENAAAAGWRPWEPDARTASDDLAALIERVQKPPISRSAETPARGYEEMETRAPAARSEPDPPDRDRWRRWEPDDRTAGSSWPGLDGVNDRPGSGVPDTTPPGGSPGTNGHAPRNGRHHPPASASQENGRRRRTPVDGRGPRELESTAPWKPTAPSDATSPWEREPSGSWQRVRPAREPGPPPFGRPVAAAPTGRRTSPGSRRPLGAERLIDTGEQQAFPVEGRPSGEPPRRRRRTSENGDVGVRPPVEDRGVESPTGRHHRRA